MDQLGRLLITRDQKNDATDNSKYAAYMGPKLKEWSDTIRCAGDRPVTLCETLKYFAAARSKFAGSADSQNYQGFGQLRGPEETVTPITGRYRAYRKRALALLGGGRTHTIVEGKLELTTVRRNCTHLEWVHTKSHVVGDCIERMDQLWQAAQTAPAGDGPEILAQLHWWGAQAMPFQRGSAAIVDASVRSIEISRGWTPRAWRKETAPDCEALLSTLSGFCKLYRSLHVDSSGFP